MTVEKYKPTTTPHSQAQRLEDSVLRVEKNKQASREAVVRSKQIIGKAQVLIETSQEICRHLHGHRHSDAA